MMMLRSLVLAVACLSTSAVALADKPTFEVKDNRLVLPGPVVFETASAKLKPESDKVLAHVKAYLDDKTYISLMRVENHSDSQGKDDVNLKLSQARALAIAKALVAQGIDCKRLVAVGFGETKPVADNATAEGRAANRRSEFVNAALRGRAIGGMPADGGGRDAGDVCK